MTKCNLAVYDGSADSVVSLHYERKVGITGNCPITQPGFERVFAVLRAAICRRICRCFDVLSNSPTLSAWVSCCRPASVSFRWRCSVVRSCNAGHSTPPAAAHLPATAIPPKYSVTQVVGFIRGKSDSFGARVGGAESEFYPATFLGTRIFVSAVGRDEAVIRQYIKTRRGKVSDWIS
jgi:hypothetical protein